MRKYLSARAVGNGCKCERALHQLSVIEKKIKEKSWIMNNNINVVVGGCYVYSFIQFFLRNPWINNEFYINSYMYDGMDLLANLNNKFFQRL